MSKLVVFFVGTLGVRTSSHINCYTLMRKLVTVLRESISCWLLVGLSVHFALFTGCLLHNQMSKSLSQRIATVTLESTFA